MSEWILVISGVAVPFFALGTFLGRWAADNGWLWSAELGSAHCIRGRFFYVAEEGDEAAKKHMAVCLGCRRDD